MIVKKIITCSIDERILKEIENLQLGNRSLLISDALLYLISRKKFDSVLTSESKTGTTLRPKRDCT